MHAASVCAHCELHEAVLSTHDVALLRQALCAHVSFVVHPAPVYPAGQAATVVDVAVFGVVDVLVDVVVIALHTREKLPTPTPMVPLGHVVTQLPLYRYFWFLHNVQARGCRVVASKEQLRQLAPHEQSKLALFASLKTDPFCWQLTTS